MEDESGMKKRHTITSRPQQEQHVVTMLNK